MTKGSVPDITGAVHTKLCLAISDPGSVAMLPSIRFASGPGARW